MDKSKELSFIDKVNEMYFAQSEILVDVVIIGGAKDECIICSDDNGRTYNLEFVYNNLILPHVGCFCKKGCRCTLGFQAARDKDGKIIYK